MGNHEKVLQAIFEAVDEANQQFPPTQRLEKSVDTVLWGDSGVLDSLGLVTLIVTAEQKIGARFSVPITLADEKAISRKRSPFRTIGTLAEYAVLLLEGKDDE